ncbi:MAG: response regulator [Treponema sp.]|nr:response regulator [Treponema sp.]MCL2252331.1 response regulator [Treponema sp.]
MKNIFIVDDSNITLSIVNTGLREYYRVTTIISAEKMFEILDNTIPDLILLDIEMPGMNGFEALRLLKSSKEYSKIPVMFLTGHTNKDIEVQGFEMGAIDFLTKPFSVSVLLNRIRKHLSNEEIIQKRTQQLQRMQNSIVSVLADLVENRDMRTNGHIERTSIYLKILIEEMIKHGVYSEELLNWDIEKIISSARMHDIGKITISDSLINKKDKYTDTEYERIKTHTTEGERIIDEIIMQTGENDFLCNAKFFAGFHHERWDGKGYPRGLKGEEIPLQGRIMAIVDSYDALVSERSYKKPISHEEAVKIIKKNAGIIYDPKIAIVFCDVNELFLETLKDN